MIPKPAAHAVRKARIAGAWLRTWMAVEPLCTGCKGGVTRSGAPPSRFARRSLRKSALRFASRRHIGLRHRHSGLFRSDTDRRVPGSHPRCQPPAGAIATARATRRTDIEGTPWQEDGSANTAPGNRHSRPLRWRLQRVRVRVRPRVRRLQAARPPARRSWVGLPGRRHPARLRARRMACRGMSPCR